MFGFKTPIPYPFGTERTGYLVTDLDKAITLAKASGVAAAVAYLAAPGSHADDSDLASTSAVHERPEIRLNRWQEDWSVLANPELRTEPLDNLKYVPLSSDDPNSYLSLGLDLRERMESTQIAPFGIGNPHSNTYEIQRLDIYAAVHPNANWQIFVQLQDDRAFGKDSITPTLDTTPPLSFDRSSAVTPDCSVASCPAASASSLSRSRSLPRSIFSYPSVRGFCTSAFLPYARAMVLRRAPVVSCLRS
ncbi:MAG TPA: alginate export family protein [Steroidobacteraceae bacterium]|nr:alginate export family protein [Steroidobacteraceae bacterium]